MGSLEARTPSSSPAIVACPNPNTDLEDFEYKLLMALIENVVFRIDKGFEPALYIVRGRAVEAIPEEYPKLNRVIQVGGFFVEDTLTPDESMRFGSAKGGNKYNDETVDVITDEVGRRHVPTTRRTRKRTHDAKNKRNSPTPSVETTVQKVKNPARFRTACQFFVAPASLEGFHRAPMVRAQGAVQGLRTGRIVERFYF